MSVETRKDVMEYRVLGRTELRASVLGYGTSPLGDVYGTTTLADSIRAVHFAIDHGINFFDSSPYYGLKLAEQRLGDALAGKRDKVILATKAGRYGLDAFDFSAKRITASIDESLKRLKTDYVDLLQAHDIEFGSFDEIVEETLPALREIQKAGKARYVGITGYPPKFLAKVALKIPVDTVLSYCRYTLLAADMDEVLTPLAKQHSIGLINASPLHMGMLTERDAPKWHPAAGGVHAAVRRIDELCQHRGQSVPSTAIRFCLDHPYVSTTLIGMATEAEVQANLALLQMKSDATLIAEIRTAVGPAFNRDWPSGKPENNGSGN
jgi:L-galactose dehydrogenase